MNPENYKLAAPANASWASMIFTIGFAAIWLGFVLFFIFFSQGLLGEANSSAPPGFGLMFALIPGFMFVAGSAMFGYMLWGMFTRRAKYERLKREIQAEGRFAVADLHEIRIQPDPQNRKNMIADLLVEFDGFKAWIVGVNTAATRTMVEGQQVPIYWLPQRRGEFYLAVPN